MDMPTATHQPKYSNRTGKNMNPEEQSTAANSQLENLYDAVLDPWRKLRASNRDLSIPMLLKTTPAYFAARPRVVFVGQETHGWWTDCSITSDILTARPVMDFYQGPVMTKHRVHSPSPFWHAVRKILRDVGLSNFPDSVLTTNLFPCDSEKTQAPEAALEAMRGWKLLPEELRILDPEFVVFFVGPHYADNIRAYLGKPVSPPISTENVLQAYVSETGSWKGWVTYHPRWLQQHGHHNVLDQISEGIRQAGW